MGFVGCVFGCCDFGSFVARAHGLRHFFFFVGVGELMMQGATQVPDDARLGCGEGGGNWVGSAHSAPPATGLGSGQRRPRAVASSQWSRRKSSITITSHKTQHVVWLRLDWRYILHRYYIQGRIGPLTIRGNNQAPAAAFPSGRRCSPATSSTQTPRTAQARRSALPCSRTTTSAYTTAKRYNCPTYTPDKALF